MRRMDDHAISDAIADRIVSVGGRLCRYVSAASDDEAVRMLRSLSDADLSATQTFAAVLGDDLAVALLCAHEEGRRDGLREGIEVRHRDD